MTGEISPASNAVLHVDAVTKSFGGVYALEDVSLTVARGEARGLIGPNGAGKSTFFNVVAGNIKADRGAVRFDDRQLGNSTADARARAGISMVHQNGGLFGRLTVLENVMMGWQARTAYGFWRAALGGRAKRRVESEQRRESLAALSRLGLVGLADRPASVLTFGQQRTVQIARALCSKPAMLLLDEPAAGLRDAERSSLLAVLRDLKESGLTMLLIEHDVEFVRRLVDHLAVLVLGRKIADGSTEQVLQNAEVIQSYLGTGASDAEG